MTKEEDVKQPVRRKVIAVEGQAAQRALLDAIATNSVCGRESPRSKSRALAAVRQERLDGMLLDIRWPRAPEGGWSRD